MPIQEDFWKTFMTFTNNLDGLWMKGGDFNAVLFILDISRGHA